MGFRYTARQIAQRFTLGGYVKNLSDGRVELVVEGDPEEIDRFLAAIDQAMAGYIRDREIQAQPAEGLDPGFAIRF